MPKDFNRKVQGLLTLLLLTSSLAVLLAACSRTSPSAPKTETTGTPSPSAKMASPSPRPSPTPSITPEPISQLEVDPASLRGVMVQIWHPWMGAEEQRLKELIQDFNANNEWGILAVASPAGSLDELSASLEEALRSGGAPDLAVGYHHQALTWDREKKLVDLNRYIEDPGWGLDSLEQEDFYPAFWEQDVSGDKRLGVPALRSGQVLYYNTAWARELGFEQPPETPQELKQQACAAAQANRQDDDPKNDQTGGLILSTHYSAILGWIYAFGGQVTEGDSYQYDTPQARQAFTYLRDLYDAGCAWLADSQVPDDEFANRQGLFAVGSVAGIPYQAGAFSRAGNDDAWTVLAFPSPVGQPAISVYGPSFHMITSTEEEQLAAWVFTRWLLSAQSQARFVEASQSFPIRASVLEALEQPGRPQWQAAVDLLPSARPEPAFQSWNLVRWAVFDAATQLFRYYFKIDQVSNLMKLLDQTAEDLNNGPP